MVVLFGFHFNPAITLGKTLMSITGIGRSYADYLSAYYGFSFKTPLGEVPREVLKNLSHKTMIERPVSLTLKRLTYTDLRFKIQLKTYQGIRYAEGLPVRGQNTKSNARTTRMRRKKPTHAH